MLQTVSSEAGTFCSGPITPALAGAIALAGAVLLPVPGSFLLVACGTLLLLLFVAMANALAGPIEGQGSSKSLPLDSQTLSRTMKTGEPELTMPSKAPTPRTTRNSRGVRQSPAVFVPAPSPARATRVSKRASGANTTPFPAIIAGRRALAAAAPVSIPETPTPAPRLLPTATTTNDDTTRRRIFPPPVALPPQGTTPTTTNTPLQHPRVASIRGTPAAADKGPRTPLYHPQRFLTRYVDRTPLPPVLSTPESPAGHETSRFRARRQTEREEEFARELYIAIRNDHLMRDCWCGPPIIFNSREEAEEGRGHFRFYTTGPDDKTLRVIQKKDDPIWHCICGQQLHPVYKDVLNANGKRPATDSELDLIAQNEGLEASETVEKVLPAQVEEVEAGTQPRSMWQKACGLVNRAVSTMKSPLTSLFGKLREAYETVDTRRWSSPDDDTIIVKRVKRSVQNPSSPEDQVDDSEFERLVWASTPIKRVGYFKLQEFKTNLQQQMVILNSGSIIGGRSIAEIQAQIEPGQDLGASIAVHQYQQHLLGPVTSEQSEKQRAENMIDAYEGYMSSLSDTLKFLNDVYSPGFFQDIKRQYKTPPRKLPLGNYMFRRTARVVAEFMCFLHSLKELLPMPRETLEIISKICVDANAVHKQEMVPSFVEVAPSSPSAAMPGYFPEEEQALEDLSIDQLTVEPFYEFRYPSPDPSDSSSPIRDPGVYRKIAKPKGILKPSKKWEAPPSPKAYVATPEKKRALAFENPVSRFIPPSHIPARVMTPYEAKQLVTAKRTAEILRDKHSIQAFESQKIISRASSAFADPKKRWLLDDLEKDDEELGLSYHAQKYTDFLDGVKEDLEEREEKKKKKEEETREKVPTKYEVQIPMPRRLRTPERKRREAARAAVLNDTLSSPVNPSPYANPFQKKAPEQPLEEIKPRPRAVDLLFGDDDDDELQISTAKLAELQLARQIREEFQASVKREAEEKRQREIEEAAAAEKRRLEEEQRKKEEARKRKEEEARRKKEEQLRKETEEFARLTGLRRPHRPLISEMSRDWHHRVNDIYNAGPGAPLARTLEGQDLVRRDFEEMLLPPTAWLNDNVIIGSILHVAAAINAAKKAPDNEPKCAAFTSYLYPRIVTHGAKNCGRLLRKANVRKQNFFDIETILVPICEQSHWTLAVIRPGQRTVAHIDSIRGGRGDKAVTDRMLELTQFILEDQFKPEEWKAVNYTAPKQTNGWDCGVFTITNALCIALGVDPNQAYTAGQLTAQRRRLAAVLLNGGFKGDFGLDDY